MRKKLSRDMFLSPGKMIHRRQIPFCSMSMYNSYLTEERKQSMDTDCDKISNQLSGFPLESVVNCKRTRVVENEESIILPRASDRNDFD